MEILIILFFLVVPIFGYLIYKQLRQNVGTSTTAVEFIVIALFVISTGLFCFNWMLNSADYYTAIDIVDGGYSPFSSHHGLTLIVFFVLAMFGLIKLWLKGRALPPLLFVLCIVFVIIGVGVSFAVIFQISARSEAKGSGYLFGALPSIYILTSIIILVKVITEEVDLAANKIYKNKFLNYLNQRMAKVNTQPFWIFLLLIPVFVIVVAILMLFGQDANSITKVFTETTTWNFSQKTHPPFLDHKGHYLCTVAVCGTPEIVKPLRLGKRHGYEIVVNRQLLIANAFEELIQESAPALHKMIRSFYDKYGYPLSKKITTAKGSNLVYRLMKPLEYLFLIVLYLCSAKPEERIEKQYSL